MKLKIISLVLLVLAFAFFWPGSGKRWVEIDVKEGANAHDVAQLLKDGGLIGSPYPFLVWVKLRSAGPRIQLGRYRFSAGRSAFWIVDDLIQGRTQKAHLVIPEGFGSWQVAERLESLKICDGEAFKRVVSSEALEGFLCPATYEMDFGLRAETVAHRLVARFDLQWNAELESRAKEIGMTKKEVVTFASIIEREVKVRDELPLISAVYHNRLKKKMKLEADPTVQFALGFWKPRLTYQDLRTAHSPYNTYLVAGLPPGPICNPGLDAIKAALWPVSSDALFFVAGEDGHHLFSNNYREHAIKVNQRNRKNMLKRSSL